jgi:DNA (cytosine-5)-methyltransferase 1
MAKKFDYHFPLPTHGAGTENRILTMRDMLSDMEPWPKGDFSTESFHGHYLTRKRKRDWDEPSYTIVADESHVPLHPIGEPMKRVGPDQWKRQGKLNRRLSWKECRVLQCLPETLEPEGSLGVKYRVIGNAVPPVFAKALLEPVVIFEQQKY